MIKWAVCCVYCPFKLVLQPQSNNYWNLEIEMVKLFSLYLTWVVVNFHTLFSFITYRQFYVIIQNFNNWVNWNTLLRLMSTALNKLGIE